MHVNDTILNAVSNAFNFNNLSIKVKVMKCRLLDTGEICF